VPAPVAVFQQLRGSGLHYASTKRGVVVFQAAIDSVVFIFHTFDHSNRPQMNLTIAKDYSALSAMAAAEIASVVRHKPHAVLCLAAGDTPRLTYAILSQNAAKGEVDFSQCSFIGLDEWVGIPKKNEGSCAYFLKHSLFDPLGIAANQIHLFDALSPEPNAECTRMDDTINRIGGIDLMLVGVGMNGHIGFNEPGVSADLYTHVVALDAVTKSVGQKYFKHSTELRYGITLGLKHLLDSGAAIVIASGEKKAGVVKQALSGAITTAIPASFIRKHPNGMVIVDQEAASQLHPLG
jgi:glucosamine-6-phosphate isomerase